MFKRILLAIALVFTTFSLAGCKTVQGVGRDITWVGEAGAGVLDEIFYPPHKNEQPEVVYREY